jgi:hypothetical protein
MAAGHHMEASGLKTLGLWGFPQDLLVYNVGMDVIIFAAIVFFSWFPFKSNFQPRIQFNQGA